MGRRMVDLLDASLRLKELLLRRATNKIVPPGFPADLSRAEEESEEKHGRPYRECRAVLLANPGTAGMVPAIVRASETLDGCWNLLKADFPASSGSSHDKRTEFIRQAFEPLLHHLGHTPAIQRGVVSNYRRIATRLGQGLRGTTLNEIDRVAKMVFPFSRTDHSEESITSSRSQRVFDWVLTLSEQAISEEEKDALLRSFVEELVAEGDPLRGLIDPGARKPTDFWWASVHQSVRAVAEPRFAAGQRADAVEAALKEVNNRVKRQYKLRTGTELDGKSLMMKAFSPTKPEIVLGDLSTESGQNEQEGYMFIFAGAMQALRNPKAHANLDIDESRAMHHLLVASLLMSKLDEAKVPA